MKTQFVRGSKALGLFVIGSVLLAQLFVGGAISIASAQTEVTSEPEVVSTESQLPTPEVICLLYTSDAADE